MCIFWEYRENCWKCEDFQCSWKLRIRDHIVAQLPSLSSFAAPQGIINRESKSGKNDHYRKQECPPCRFTWETRTSVMTLGYVLFVFWIRKVVLHGFGKKNCTNFNGCFMRHARMSSQGPRLSRPLSKN